MSSFFRKYWFLYYVLFFLLLGLLIYALFWKPKVINNQTEIEELEMLLEACKEENENLKILPKNPPQTPPKTGGGVVNCNAEVKSGNQGFTSTIHNLGTNPGTVVVKYDMQNIPDEIVVYYNNKIVGSSNGAVQGFGSFQFYYNPQQGMPNSCKVDISAPQDSTQWSYIVNCPL